MAYHGYGVLEFGNSRVPWCIEALNNREDLPIQSQVTENITRSRSKMDGTCVNWSPMSTYARMCACTNMYICVRMCVRLHACVHACVRACVWHVRACMRARACARACLRACICTCVHVHMQHMHARMQVRACVHLLVSVCPCVAHTVS